MSGQTSAAAQSRMIAGRIEFGTVALCMMVSIAGALGSAGIYAQTPSPIDKSSAGSAYPTKPVRVIVPGPPGGGADIVARLVSAKLAERLEQQFVVDNRPGAGSLLGIELTLKSPPDGYTILIMSSSFSVIPTTHKRASDYINNFAPIGEIGILPLVVAVHPSLPARNVAELIALAKSKPGQLNYGIPGIGNISHLAAELMLDMARIRITGVPYKGTAPAMLDTISGQVHLILGTLPPVQPHFQTGKLRPLAVTSAKRWHTVPNLPTLEETLPGYVVELWYGVIAPKGTPQPIVNRLNSALNQLLQDSEFLVSVAKEGSVPSGGTAEQFGERVRKEYERWRMVVERANLKPQPE